MRLLVTLALLLSPTHVRAIETIFQHRFERDRVYDNDDTALNSTSVPTGVTSRDSSRQHWNTRTLVAQFGMEAGGRVDIGVLELSVLPPAHTPRYPSTKHRVPLVFTLLDADQWRAFSALQLRGVPLRAPAVLCHYPSVMRFAAMTNGGQEGASAVGGDSDGGGGDDSRDDGDVAALNESVTTKPWTRRTVSFVVQRSSQYTLQALVCGDASVRVKVRQEEWESVWLSWMYGVVCESPTRHGASSFVVLLAPCINGSPCLNNNNNNRRECGW